MLTDRDLNSPTFSHLLTVNKLLFLSVLLALALSRSLSLSLLHRLLPSTLFSHRRPPARLCMTQRQRESGSASRDTKLHNTCFILHNTCFAYLSSLVCLARHAPVPRHRPLVFYHGFPRAVFSLTLSLYLSVSSLSLTRRS